MDLQKFNAIVGSTAQEFAETGLSVHQLFPWQVKKMHEMYELPINITPSLDNLGESPLQRMQGFMKTLQKEMDEGQEIMALLQIRQKAIDSLDIIDDVSLHNPEAFLLKELRILGMDESTINSLVSKVAKLINEMPEDLTPLECLDRVILVMIADWLNDMTVYNRSEALKYGIPSESVLACIMGSNFTKLGEDGLPIKDENGKVQKGPNFLPPEEAIYATMFEHEQLVHEAQTLIEAADAVSTVALPILHDPMAEILLAGDEYTDDSYMLPPDEEGNDQEWK